MLARDAAQHCHEATMLVWLSSVAEAWVVNLEKSLFLRYPKFVTD